MGTYNVSTKEIVCAIAEALDEIQGDFSKADLFEALEKCKEYPHVTDYFSAKKQEKWGEYVNTP